MLQFTVPQFIDVEDKIIGPLTTRQFIILLTGAVFIGLCYRFLTFTWFVGSGFTIFGISGMFAFFKVNGMPFHFFILNFIETGKKPGLRVWNQTFTPVTEEDLEVIKKKEEEAPPKEQIITTSRLTELSLMVDTKGAFREEKNHLYSKVNQENGQKEEKSSEK